MQTNKHLNKFILLSGGMLSSLGLFAQTHQKPNVLIILADDIGYGDLSPYAPTEGCTLLTPNVQQLANQGTLFTNGHAAAATSTPSRYSILTGRYPWRRHDTGIAPGDAALIIHPNKEYTIANLFHDNGYTTAAIGKWHLGLGTKRGTQDWNGLVAPGPNQIGFDYSYIMAATADRVPCVFLENERVVNDDPKDPIEVNYFHNFPGEPTGKSDPELLTKMKPSHGHDQSIVNGISRIGYMKGGKKALWVDENIADSINYHTYKFIEKAKEEKKPFFVYMCTNDIHVPRMPNKRFQGKSGMGYRGDAILEFDYSVGYIMHKLDSLGLRDNTIVILTSDNGPVLDDGYKDQAVELNRSHKPWGPFRGGKYSAYEAGTRVPLIVSAPKLGVPSGKESNALVCQIDFVRSLAKLLHFKQDKISKDSHDISLALFRDAPNGRHHLMEGSYTLSVITDNGWKYIVPSKGKSYWVNTNTETGLYKDEQLYNLNNDPGEYTNVIKQHPLIAKKLKAIIEKEKKIVP